MGMGSAKKMKIEVRTDDGQHDPVVGLEDGMETAAEELTPEEMAKLYQDPGFKFVGVVLHAKSSPGCVYFVVGGRAFRVCR